MKKYVIERPIPGVGSLTRNQLHAGSARSCAALEELGPDIQWVQSYVTADKIYCVHEAEDAEAIIEHSRRCGFPADVVAEIVVEFGPYTAGQQALPVRARR